MSGLLVVLEDGGLENRLAVQPMDIRLVQCNWNNSTAVFARHWRSSNRVLCAGDYR